ncbi:YutD family protein [Streptococcus suis]
MKKEITPEMYNYNKYPGPSFARVGDKVVSENIELDLLENHKDAFDQTIFGQRFSQLMLKFDYIVGDWGNEQLRLKGFYKDDKTVKSDLKIGRLDDYLTEFCNFGCAYFVLENPNPQELPEEVEDRPRRKRSRSRNRNRNQQRTEPISHKEQQKAQPEKKGRDNRAKSNRNDRKKGARQDKVADQSRHFTVHHDKKAGKQAPKQESRQASDAKETKSSFVIRQK